MGLCGNLAFASLCISDKDPYGGLVWIHQTYDLLQFLNWVPFQRPSVKILSTLNNFRRRMFTVFKREVELFANFKKMIVPE